MKPSVDTVGGELVPLPGAMNGSFREVHSGRQSCSLSTQGGEMKVWWGGGLVRE